MFNKNIITILLVTFCLVIFVFQHVQNLNKRVKMLESNKEKFGDVTIENLREEVMKAVDSTYNMDTEAIRNLGAISKSILTGKNYHNLDGDIVPGKLVIPANVEIQGELTVHQKLIVTSGKNYDTGPNAVSDTGVSIYDGYVDQKIAQEKIEIDVKPGHIPKIKSYHRDKKLHINTYDAGPGSVYGTAGKYGGNPYNSLQMFSNKTEITRPLSILTQTQDGTITLRTMLGHNYYKGNTYKHLDTSTTFRRHRSLPVGFVIHNTEVSDSLDVNSYMTDPHPENYRSPEELEYTHNSINFISAPSEGNDSFDCLTRVIRTGIAISMPRDAESATSTIGGWGGNQYMKIGHIEHFNGDVPDRMSPFGIHVRNTWNDRGGLHGFVIKTDDQDDKDDKIGRGYITFHGREISAHNKDDEEADRYPIKIPHLLLTEFHGMGLKDINETGNYDNPLITKHKGIPEELQGDDLYFMSHHGGARETDGDWQWKIVPFMDKKKWASN